jgi:hypothetical protein
VTLDALAPPFFLAAGLLILSGAVKVVTPDATAQALLDAGLPGTRRRARALGIAEVGTGIWALAAPASGGAIACGLLYLAFAAFLGYVLSAHPEAGSCGCAGPTPVPPSRLHLGLNAIAAAASFAFATTVAPEVSTWLGSLGSAALPVLFGLAVGGWLAVIVVTLTPAAFRSWAPPVHDHEAEPHGHDHAVADRQLEAAGVTPGHASLWPGTKD